MEEKKKRLCSRFFIWKEIANHIEFGFKKCGRPKKGRTFLFLFFEIVSYFFLAGAFFKNEGTESFKIADGKGVFFQDNAAVPSQHQHIQIPGFPDFCNLPVLKANR